MNVACSADSSQLLVPANIEAGLFDQHLPENIELPK